jgi:mannan endo-1,4-beta-mannosidase
VTITNTGAAPVVIEQAFLTAVPLVGAPSSFAPLTSATTIAPGAALVVSASRTFTAADPAGSWSIVATYLDASGAAHASATTYFVLAAPGPPAFVTVDRANGRFLLAGQPFYFCGTDAYYLAQEHAYGSPVTTDALDAARAVGMRVVRTIGYFDGYDVAGTTSSDPAIIQLSPGVYRESGFQGMDFVISEAGKRGIKLVINLVNNWTSFGGMQQYVQWAGLTDHDAFFTNPAVKQFYQNYLRDFVNRRNTFTGIAYKDDPTILGWELANEARCASDPGATQGILAAWYQEMATYLKSLDSNHLVSTGEEGNDVTTSGYSSYTNGSWLDGTTGSSYRANIALSAIDWGTVHVYPDAAGMTDPLNDGSNWILDHVKIAAAQGKPLFVGEYGLQTSPHSIYASWLDVVASSGAAGSAVWEMIPPSRAAQTTENTDVLYPNDPEVSALENDAVLMNAK